MLAALRQYPTGVNIDELSDYEAQRLVESGWKYGDPAPPTFRYNENGLLEHIDRTVWDNVAQYGSLAVPVVATIATGGAASPWLMAAAGGITGAMSAGNGNWKDMLRAGTIGGVTGGAGAGIANSGLTTGTKIAAQGAIGAGTGAIQNGGKGALLGGVTGAGGAAAGQLANQQAASGVGRTQQLMTQAGIQSALGGLSGGVPGAVVGAGQGAANNALYQQRFKQYQQQQQQRQRII
jgi:hypothetical protein